MESNIIIRDFIEQDIPDLAHLMIELGYPTKEEEMSSRIKNNISNKDYKTIVAVSNNKVVGLIGLIKNFFWERN